MNKILLRALVLFIASISQASTCDLKSSVTGFSRVKSEGIIKSFFYKDPIKCQNEKACSSKRKAFIVPKNFVQIAGEEGEFVCAIFRNFNGYGGKITQGWILKSDLEPIKNKLSIEDFVDSEWWSMKCSAGDDCMIIFSQDKKKKWELEVSSHLHNGPGMILQIEKIEEKEDRFELFISTLSKDKTLTKVEIIFHQDHLEPGTILLKGDEYFNGVYRR
jgi:hypothetical protein